MIEAGRLRHRVTIEQRSDVQDTTTGAMVPTWTVFADGVPAAIEDLSVRESLAGQAMQSTVTTRITIRYMDGLTADMRIKHGDLIYNMQQPLADKGSGRVYLTIPCSKGVNNG